MARERDAEEKNAPDRKAERPAARDQSPPLDIVDEASDESFPASDPPGYGKLTID